MGLTPKQALQIGNLMVLYGTSTFNEGRLVEAGADPESLLRQQETTRGFVLRIKNVLEALTDADEEDKVEL